MHFEAYTDLVGMSEYMDEAEARFHEIDNDLLSTADAVNCSEALFAFLVGSCRPGAGR